MAALRELAEAGWERDVVASPRPAVVLFWAEWCVPCRTVLPWLERLAARWEGRAVVGTVDVDRNPGLAQRYGVGGLPTVLLFREGREAGRRIGLIEEERLESLLAAL